MNQRVLFWVSEKRLNRLLAARAYREKQHCVLTLQTEELVRAHAERVSLSPINSGSTIFSPQPRGATTFTSIVDYHFDTWKRKRGKQNAVVELVEDYSVPDVADFVLKVEERKGEKVLSVVFKR